MLPTLFLSHGSPLHALQPGALAAVWVDIARRLPTPRAILVASAHWETELPMVATSARPPTLHDFSGFPAPLYEIQYPAPGAPAMAQRALSLLRAAGFVATANACRGLDHGAWVPLRFMFPQADVPVAQISLQPSLGAAHHLRLGQALAPLCQEGVLIVGSGHMTHNLYEWMRGQPSWPAAEGAVAPYVEEFRRWVQARLAADEQAALARWEELAPHARRAHPTPEHFLPLFVALGAAGKRPRVEHVDAGVEGGVLALDAYLLWPQAVPALKAAA